MDLPRDTQQENGRPHPASVVQWSRTAGVENMKITTDRLADKYSAMRVRILLGFVCPRSCVINDRPILYVQCAWSYELLRRTINFHGWKEFAPRFVISRAALSLLTNIKLAYFWDTTQCRLVAFDRRFRHAYCLNHRPWRWKQYFHRNVGICLQARRTLQPRRPESTSSPP